MDKGADAEGRLRKALIVWAVILAVSLIAYFVMMSLLRSSGDLL